MAEEQRTSWLLVFGLWSLVFGLWSLVFGLWSLVFGLWSLAFGRWPQAIDSPSIRGEDRRPKTNDQRPTTHDSILNADTLSAMVRTRPAVAGRRRQFAFPWRRRLLTRTAVSGTRPWLACLGCRRQRIHRLH